MNESEGGYQELTGFTRVKGNRWLGGKAGNSEADERLDALWDYVQAVWNNMLNPGSGGGNGGSTESTNADVSLYGLYESADAAAFGWARLFASYGNTTAKIEYSGLIYSIKIKEHTYFGFTRAVRFQSNKKAKQFSPGPDDESHKSTLPLGAEIVGHIHMHYAASDPVNRAFSSQEDGDEDLIADNPQLSFYLLNSDGNLIVHQSKEYFAGTPYTDKVGYNFYGFEHIPGYIEKTNGIVTARFSGNIAYPERTVILPCLNNTYPSLYIDFASGKPYGLDRWPLK